MSAIGDYVHMTLAGYYGGGHATKDRRPYHKNAIDTYKNKIEERKRKAVNIGKISIAEDYEKLYNGLLYNEELLGGTEDQKQKIREVREQAFDDIDDFLQQKWKGLVINRENLSINNLNQLSIDLKQNKSETDFEYYTRLLTESKKIYDIMVDKYEKMSKELKNKNKSKDAPSKEELQTLKRYLDLCAHEGATLSKYIEDMDKLERTAKGSIVAYGTSISGRKEAVATLFRYSKAGVTSSKATMWGDSLSENNRGGLINRLLYLLNRYEPSSAYFLGMAFEQISENMIKKGLIIMAEELEEELKKEAVSKINQTKRVGNKSSNVAYVKSNFAVPIEYSVRMKNDKVFFASDINKNNNASMLKWLEKWEKQWNNPNASFVVSTKAQEKTDLISVTFKQRKDSKVVASKAKMSLKNYSGLNVNLVGGTNWVSVLQTENDNNYVNHLLNLFTANTKNYNGVDQARSYSLQSDLVYAHKSMKWILLLSALTGMNMLREYPNGVRPIKDNPNYLVVNDHSQKEGYVHVYSMGEICQKIGENIDEWFIVQGMVSRYDDTNTYDNDYNLGSYTKNDYKADRTDHHNNSTWYVSAANNRISHILGVLRIAKIKSAHLKLSMMKK